MANTTTIQGPMITMVLDGSTDWLWNTDTPFTTGIKVHSIRFHPSAANDVMIMNDHSISGPEIFRVKCSGDTDDRVQYYGGAWLQPCIDVSDCTLSTPANVRVTIHMV